MGLSSAPGDGIGRRTEERDVSAFGEAPPGNGLIRRHTLVGELFQGAFRLIQAAETHSPENMRCFGKLDVVVADNLDAVTPRVEKVEEAIADCACLR